MLYEVITGTFGNGTISGSFATGTVIAAGSSAGGFVGVNSGIIEHCYATGSVTNTASAERTGGFAGWNSSSNAIT